MWLLTPVGFFSIVQKPSDLSSDTLTVRARVRGDLDALRTHYLPELSEVKESVNTDYRFRATAPRASVAKAMAQCIEQLTYSNFKSEVAKRQGSRRAHLYHDVWEVLYRLQQDKAFLPTNSPSSSQANTQANSQAKVQSKSLSQTQAPAVASKSQHPRPDDKGKPVVLNKPSQPSSLEAWHRSDVVACVVPQGPMPAMVAGMALNAWSDAPKHPDQWLELAKQHLIDEPEFKVPSGYKRAAGVVVREKDGRIWLVAPSNQFGGYQHTFPKGTVEFSTAESSLNNQATALVEAYEESGLQVRLIAHLVDVKRSQSYTRYYLAERVGGNPADMGWETQAVLLSPVSQLGKLLNSAYDKPILELLHAQCQ